MKLVQNADLRPFNSFRVPAKARAVARVDHWYELERLFENPRCPMPWLVLGEGSNVLFRNDFPGTVVRIDNRGIRITDESRVGVFVRVAAGENWHNLVRWSASEGLWGIENLALIPGTAGAAPLQNIGAYGVELKDVLHRVHAYDRILRKWVEFSNSQCKFGYRTSRFKEDPDSRFIITEVTLRLSREGKPVTNYAGVSRLVRNLDEPTPADMVKSISKLRKQKLPDPAEHPNVGSFFKNPVISKPDWYRLRDAYPSITGYNEGKGYKVSAAWLIEKSGMKGRRVGDACVSDRHALVLTNEGNATGQQLWELAKTVQEAVYNRFQVVLDPEPLIV